MSELTYFQEALNRRQEHVETGPGAYFGVENGHRMGTRWAPPLFAQRRKRRNHLKRLARPTGFEPVTPAFGVRHFVAK